MTPGYPSWVFPWRGIFNLSYTIENSFGSNSFEEFTFRAQVGLFVYGLNLHFVSEGGNYFSWKFKYTLLCGYPKVGDETLGNWWGPYIKTLVSVLTRNCHWLCVLFMIDTRKKGYVWVKLSSKLLILIRNISLLVLSLVVKVEKAIYTWRLTLSFY